MMELEVGNGDPRAGNRGEAWQRQSAHREDGSRSAADASRTPKAARR
jgi:hypothetical protein